VETGLNNRNTGDANIMTVGVQNNAASKARRKYFLYVPPLVIFCVTLVAVADEVDKNVSNKFVGARRQFGGHLLIACLQTRLCFFLGFLSVGSTWFVCQ